MTSPPAWRRMRPDGTAARLLAACCALGCLALVTAIIAIPLLSALSDAAEREARAAERVNIIEASMRARLAEAATTTAPTDMLVKATTYLDQHAPVDTAEDALLGLVSSLRLIAQATDVELKTVTPIPAERLKGTIRQPLDMAGINVSAAQVRLVSDHQGLARFLAATERATPTLRAVAMDVAARSTAATVEDNRLAITLTVFALSRAEGKG